jgi:mono/diheme cytochrome c family protein
MKKIIFISFAFAVLFTSCLFDNIEETYPIDTTTPTTTSFLSDIFPIIQSECITCHGATSPSGGVSLNTYDNIKISVDNGSFYGSLTGNGYQLMPQYGTLPTAQIELVETWINEGALDN